MTSGSDDFLPTQNVWSFKSRRVELRTFEIPVVGGVFGKLGHVIFWQAYCCFNSENF